MSLPVRRAAVLAALLLTAACADRPLPVEPARTPPEPVYVAPLAQQARHERLARRLALALRDDEFRATVARALAGSLEPEGKVHLQRFLDGNRGAIKQRLGTLAGDRDGLDTDVMASASIEIYLPVPEHRRNWHGGAEVLVATAEGDEDRPVAFDVRGRRRLLDATLPPSIPVIALGRAELRFDEAAIPLFDGCLTCESDPYGGFGGGGGGGVVGGGGVTTTPASAGLYMTYAKYNDTFEGWLKGSPEFEIHVLGQDGTSNAMKSYQCAGEKQGTPYQFDQNDKEWSGSVMLFSQTQLDSYKAQHPGQAIRVFVVEDDDGSCVIKTDSARVTKLFQQLSTTYGVLTAGKDTTQSAIKIFKKAMSLFQVFKSGWSVITTQDDVVGNAIEDVVAQEYFPGANWVIKGDNTTTNGAIRLQMR